MNPIRFFPFDASPTLPQQHICQETDVSIAREVDKDLEANGEAGAEDAGESASARHAAREKQREVGRAGDQRWFWRGFYTIFTIDMYINIMCMYIYI